MIKDYKAYLFDLDNTLISSVSIWHDIDIATLGKYNITIDEEFSNDKHSFIKNCKSDDIYDAYNKYIIQKYKLDISPDDLRKEQLELMHKTHSELTYIKGAGEFLIQSKQKGKRLCLVTLSTLQNVSVLKSQNKNIKKVADFDKVFEHIITSNDVVKRKPNGECYKLALAKLNLEAKDCLVFEDSITGAMAARDAGIDLCVVYHKDSESTTAELKQLAKYYINSFTELLD